VCTVELNLELPRQPRLKNAPLVLVVCQLRFPQVIGFGEDLVRPIQVALGSDYPDVAIEDLQQVEFSPAGIKVTGTHQRLFRFRTHEENWTVTVGPESLALETTRYDDFADFIKRWASIMEATVEALKLQHQERVGLRYVNQLDASEGASRDDLARLVRPELLGIVGSHDTTERLTKSWQELRFQLDDGACTMQHGYAQRADTGQWTYTLDFDSYDEAGKPIDLESQARVLERFNHRTYELFSWVVDDELFASFEPEEKVAT
jgi:uncharacterized protein (TIGR04255 family)